MCTVTFIPREDGFLLAMNRDERWTRGAASHAPEEITAEGVRAIMPRESASGTWIGVNEAGLAFAILNRNFSGPWYEKQRSRGEIIPALLPCGDIDGTLHRLQSLSPPEFHPFTLVVISGPERRALEVIHDDRQLSSTEHPWKQTHWFSSGLSDADARSHRSVAISAAARQPDFATSQWVRRLHASHEGGEAFSICVHRTAVGSVSYTEITVNEREAAVFYLAGSPCLKGRTTELSIRLIPAKTPAP
jgi:hypothetical protein